MRYAPLGQKPEVPGYCVKEKDLEECTTHADCITLQGDSGRCVTLGRTGERYCLPRSTDIVSQVSQPTATGDLGKGTREGTKLTPKTCVGKVNVGQFETFPNRAYEKYL